MNAGSQIYFLFLQKDYNRQIQSNYAMHQPFLVIIMYFET